MSEVTLPIDPFNITQGFGGNAAAYKKFGLAGHNGWDVKTIYSDTPGGKRFIFAPQDNNFYKSGSDPSGYGNYFEIITQTSKSTWKHTFGHCHSIETFSKKKQGETMAVSDSTGNVTGPHLHWTVKRITINSDGTHTVKNYSNGYFGAVNPQEYLDEVRADISSPKPPMGNITIDTNLYEKLVSNASAKKDVATYLEIGNPDDTSADEMKRVIGGFKSRVTDLQNQLNSKDIELKKAQTEVKNQQDKVANVVADCQKTLDLKNAELNTLKEVIKTFDKERGLLNASIVSLQGEVREAQRQGGIKDLTIADLQVKLDQALKGNQPKELTVKQLIGLILSTKIKI